MERMTSGARPREMTNQSRIRGLRAAGLVCAGLLCAGLVGCGTVAASPPPATTTSPAATPSAATSSAATSSAATSSAAGGQGGALSAAGATTAATAGCGDVAEATSVTIVRHLLVARPIDGGMRTYTQHNARLVRALLGDFCAAIAHANAPPIVIDCPADFGISYTGTFYDGPRALATFVYNVTGCQRIALTASGQTRGTLLIGRAAAAAPHLKADMAAVLGLPESAVYGAPGLPPLGPAKQGA
jgi:hypothetical protein